MKQKTQIFLEGESPTVILVTVIGLKTCKSKTGGSISETTFSILKGTTSYAKMALYLEC